MVKQTSTESHVALSIIQALITQPAWDKFWKTLSPRVLTRSVRGVEALMFAREDGRDLPEGEEEKVPKELWDRRVELEYKELWDRRVEVENKELSDHRA